MCIEINIFLSGVVNISTVLSKLSHGIVELRLSRTGMTSIGVNRVAETLQNNPNMLSTLKRLDLSHNALRGEDVMVS